MKKVLVRFYNRSNLGDDLFLYVLNRRYINRITAPSIKSIELAYPESVMTHESTLSRFLDRLINKVMKRRNGRLLDLSRSHDIMIYIGGSLFAEENNMNTWAREVDFYRKLSIPYYILGSNIGPYINEGFVQVVKDIFSSASDVCLRDRYSYELVKGVPTTRMSTDIAFTLNTNDFVYIKQEKMVTLSVIDTYRKFNDITARKYEEEIISLTRKLILKGYKITLMSFCKYEGDEDAIKRILGKMDKELRTKVDAYMYGGDLDEALKVLAKSEMIVASRFHASILGLLFGKKVLPVAYSDKTINILKDMNFKGPVVDIRKIDEFDGANFDFGQLQVNDVSGQIKLAEKQFQELDKVLTKRK